MPKVLAPTTAAACPGKMVPYFITRQHVWCKTVLRRRRLVLLRKIWFRSQNLTTGGTRTRNPRLSQLFRRPMPYPFGHSGVHNLYSGILQFLKIPFLQLKHLGQKYFYIYSWKSSASEKSDALFATSSDCMKYSRQSHEIYALTWSVTRVDCLVDNFDRRYTNDITVFHFRQVR